MAVPVNLTFFLRFINPTQLLSEYNKGDNFLEGLSIRRKKRILPVTLTNNKGKSFRDPIFSFKDKDNYLQTIATTNAQNFKFVLENESSGKEKICQACYQRFTHDAMGIPVSLEVVGEKVLVHVISITHSFGCTLRLIRSLDRCLSVHRRINLLHAEQLLRFLHRKMYPKAGPLQPASDPSLLIDNGGCLTQEQYDNPKYVYKRVPNIILYPAKEQYLGLPIET